MKRVWFDLSFTQSLASKRMGSYTPMAAYASSISWRNATYKKNSQKLRLSPRNCKTNWRKRKPSLTHWHGNSKKLKRRFRSWHWNYKKLSKKKPQICEVLFKVRQAVSKKKILLVTQIVALKTEKNAWAWAALTNQKKTQNIADSVIQRTSLAFLALLCK